MWLVRIEDHLSGSLGCRIPRHAAVKLFPGTFKIKLSVRGKPEEARLNFVLEREFSTIIILIIISPWPLMGVPSWYSTALKICGCFRSSCWGNYIFVPFGSKAEWNSFWIILAKDIFLGAVVLQYETKLAVSTTITTTPGVRGRNMRISGLGRSSMQSLNH